MPAYYTTGTDAQRSQLSAHGYESAIRAMYHASGSLHDADYFAFFSCGQESLATGLLESAMELFEAVNSLAVSASWPSLIHTTRAGVVAIADALSLLEDPAPMANGCRQAMTRATQASAVAIAALQQDKAALISPPFLVADDRAA